MDGSSLVDTSHSSRILSSPSAAPPSSNEATEHLLLLLQCAIMQGVSSIKEYISNIILPHVSSNRTSKFLVRIYAHFILRLRLSSATQPHLADLVDDDTLDSVVGAYVDNLMSDRLIEMVATYASFLDRSSRIEKYIIWLNSLPARATSILMGTETAAGDSESALIIASAKRLFPEDVLEIVKGTAEVGRSTDARTCETSFTKLLVMVSAGTRLLGSLVPGAGAGGEAGGVDAHRAEALRWLGVDPEHREELVRQTNSFITQLLLESGGAKIDMVL